ncbi:Fur family transcriptional regulator [Dermacoccus nishinomiyaensis]|uniref:Fur family transcriptional regulator n=1 Tax=Dermacoccus nishinomiyaensis TaxID=1274 RepID=UPI001EF5BA5A|nr:Fur family transcriptional regulator [Dermacoccus nishinomiyaensis]MCG7429095.1 transcriptional repressor [Dermacoccus nishinomiyaensis]
MTTTPATDPRTMLRQVNLRITGPRVAILDALETRPHSDAETVIQAVRDSYGKVSTQTVYDALHAMTAHGIIRRIEPAGQSALYERRVGDNHHHLVCRQCATIVDIPCAVGDTPCLTAAHESELSEGFDIDEAEVTYWGVCRACREEAAAAPAASPVVG